MGLKQDLINAKVKALEESSQGNVEIDTSPGSYIEREAEYTKEAIVKFLTNCDFTITKLNAPVIVEKMITPPQFVSIKLETLLGDKAPILKTLKKVGKIIPGAGTVVNQLVDQLETEIKKAVKPLLLKGANLPGLNLGKDSGGLDSTGYVFIGDDPDSERGFDVDDKEGQSTFTKVKLLRQNIEDLL